jgi:hypothetical protein
MLHGIANNGLSKVSFSVFIIVLLIKLNSFLLIIERHEKYQTQFRAMFVFNCKIKRDEILKYPKDCSKNKNINKVKRIELNAAELVSPLTNLTTNEATLNNQAQQFDIYEPVSCTICNTEVGVYDKSIEIYHFFNVLTSHS